MCCSAAPSTSLLSRYCQLKPTYEHREGAAFTCRQGGKEGRSSVKPIVSGLLVGWSLEDLNSAELCKYEQTSSKHRPWKQDGAGLGGGQPWRSTRSLLSREERCAQRLFCLATRSISWIVWKQVSPDSKGLWAELNPCLRVHQSHTGGKYRPKIDQFWQSIDCEQKPPAVDSTKNIQKMCTAWCNLAPSLCHEWQL